MIRVYISGPITAPTEEQVQRNVQMADRAGRELASLGYNPFIPHKQTEGWHNTTGFTREQFLTLDFDWLELCHAILLLPGWEASLGAVAEYEYALEMGIPAVESIEDLQALMPTSGCLEPAPALPGKPPIPAEF